MKRIHFDYKVYDNCIEIIPEDKIEDNCIYEIRIKKAKSLNGKHVLRDFKTEVTTAMTPCYATIPAVKNLIADLDIPDKDILFYIREASRAADHINGAPIRPCKNGRPPYEVEKYVEAKATLNALLKAYIKKSDSSGIEGTVGDIKFKNDNTMSSMKTMIDVFKKDVTKWQDAIRGHESTNRNIMASALRGKYTMRPTPVEEIVPDFTRNGNMGIYGYHFTI
jgi:hypothetical protein